MDELVKDVLKNFKKNELVEIAEDLDLDYSGTAATLVERLIDDIEENGAPPEEDCSELLNEFIDFIYSEDEEEEDDEKLVEEEILEPDKYPDCYGFEDDRDPACRKCKITDLCKKERVTNRPDCFGVLYDEHSEECKLCIEAPECKSILESE